MLIGGASVQDVARHLNYSMHTIQRLRARHQQTGTVTDLPRSGRLHKTTAREDRYIVTCSRRNRIWRCRMIAACLMNATRTRFSVFTFLNCLRSADLKTLRPYVGVLLTVCHRRRRLNWARVHYRWSKLRWNRVFLRTNHASMFILLTEDYRYGDGLDKA